MNSELIQQGIVLTMFGMGTVCVFLLALTLITSGMSWAVMRFVGPEAGENTAPEAVVSLAGIEEPRLIAVITAAVQQYRKTRSKT